MKQKDRAKNMLDADRYGLVGSARELIRLDVERLLKEYFYLTEPVTAELSGDGDNFVLTVRARGSGTRTFEGLK